MNKLTERKTPPKTDEDHQFIWTGADRAHQLWAVFGPVAQVIQSWRWWGAAGVVILFIYRTDIAAVIAILTGAGQ